VAALATASHWFHPSCPCIQHLLIRVQDAWTPGRLSLPGQVHRPRPDPLRLRRLVRDPQERLGTGTLPLDPAASLRSQSKRCVTPTPSAADNITRPRPLTPLCCVLRGGSIDTRLFSTVFMVAASSADVGSAISARDDHLGHGHCGRVGSPTTCYPFEICYAFESETVDPPSRSTTSAPPTPTATANAIRWPSPPLSVPHSLFHIVFSIPHSAASSRGSIDSLPRTAP
jgi:hypothetical protein